MDPDVDELRAGEELPLDVPPPFPYVFGVDFLGPRGAFDPCWSVLLMPRLMSLAKPFARPRPAEARPPLSSSFPIVLRELLLLPPLPPLPPRPLRSGVDIVATTRGFSDSSSSWAVSMGE